MKKQITLGMRTWRRMERGIICIALEAIGIWGVVQNLWWSLFFSTWLKIPQSLRMEGVRKDLWELSRLSPSTKAVTQSRLSSITLSRQAWILLREGGSTTRLGRLLQGSMNIKEKIFCLMFRWTFCILVCTDREIWRYLRRVESDFRPNTTNRELREANSLQDKRQWVQTDLIPSEHEKEFLCFEGGRQLDHAVKEVVEYPSLKRF